MADLFNGRAGSRGPGILYARSAPTQGGGVRSLASRPMRRLPVKCEAPRLSGGKKPDVTESTPAGSAAVNGAFRHDRTVTHVDWRDRTHCAPERRPRHGPQWSVKSADARRSTMSCDGNGASLNQHGRSSVQGSVRSGNPNDATACVLEQCAPESLALRCSTDGEPELNARPKD